MSMTTFGHGNLIATDINKHITSKALQRIESPFDNLNIRNKKKNGVIANFLVGVA